MSDGLMPAISHAGGPDQRAAEYVRSISPPAWCLGDSPTPMTFTSGRFRLLAISGLVRISAPPPSLITQQSRRCSGVETIGELTTSSAVTTLRSMACSLYCAWCDAATLIQA